jgi:hypothetical protein
MAGKLFPQDPQNAMYAQQYLYDHGDALEARLQSHPELNENTMETLQNMMDSFSPFVAAYRHMRDVVQQHNAPELRLSFASMPDSDMRRYNHPQTREPATVFVGKDGAPPPNRDIVIWPRETATYRVSELNEHVDALAYPLLFPYGDSGWTPNLKHNPSKRTEKYQRVTAMQFYSYMLMRRADDCILPLQGGMLFQQYVCDMYSKAEAQRLAWVNLNQKQLRAEEYSGLYDAVHAAGDDEAVAKVGKKVILPSTYPGSPRHMHQNYLDAMAIVCTSTCFFIPQTSL